MAKSRKKKSYAAVIGLGGAGSLSKKAAKAHLSDLIESVDGEILWVLPFTDNSTKSLDLVLDFLDEEEARYVLIDDETIDDEEWTDAAESVVEVGGGDVYSAVVTELAARDEKDKRLILILDEESDSDVEVAEAALNEGIKVYDLTAGLALLQAVEVDEEDATEEQEEEAPADDGPGEDSPPDEPEDAISLDLPDSVIDAINGGKKDDIVSALTDEFKSPEIKELADKLGVEREKGQYARTIAKNIADFLLTDIEKHGYEDASDGDDEEPTVVVVDQSSVGADVETVKADPGQVGYIHEPLYPGEILHALASVAAEKGVSEARKFYDLLVEKDII